MKKINIYVETDIGPPRKGDVWYGYVLECKEYDPPYTEKGFCRVPNTTPNRAVLEACIAAVARVNYPCHITIHTSNTYVSTGLCRMSWWKKENWLNTKKQEIAHCALWQQLYYELSIHELHTGSSQEYRKWLLTEMERREHERIDVPEDADKEKKEET